MNYNNYTIQCTELSEIDYDLNRFSELMIVILIIYVVITLSKFDINQSKCKTFIYIFQFGQKLIEMQYQLHPAVDKIQTLQPIFEPEFEINQILPTFAEDLLSRKIKLHHLISYVI